MSCCFCVLCVLVGLIGLIQLCLGIYLNFIQTDFRTINYLVKTDTFDSYLFYMLTIFIVLGFLTLILAFVSIYSAIRQLKSTSFFLTILWSFSIILNLVIFIISLLYYFLILPKLRFLLVRTLRQTPLSTSNLLDYLQSKYTCCGITNKDDYKDLPLDPYPTSCCRVPYCWREIDINTHSGINMTTSLIHSDGCYSKIDRFVTIELWILIALGGICALVQFVTMIFLCTLYQRFKNVDEPKSIDTQGNFQNSSYTIEEHMEITQI